MHVCVFVCVYCMCVSDTQSLLPLMVVCVPCIHCNYSCVHSNRRYTKNNTIVQNFWMIFEFLKWFLRDTYLLDIKNGYGIINEIQGNLTRFPDSHGKEILNCLLTANLSSIISKKSHFLVVLSFLWTIMRWELFYCYRYSCKALGWLQYMEFN